MSEPDTDRKIGGYVFAVLDKPYCYWDPERTRVARQFLDGLDPGYPEVLTNLAVQADRESEATVSMMIRLSYHIAIESLMSFIGASFQAPLAPHVWLAKCSTGDLQRVIERIRNRRELLTPGGTCSPSFEMLSTHVLARAWPEDPAHADLAERFASFWQRLSEEFLDETNRAEYNALKHGNRVNPGGFSLSIGVERTPGVPAAPSDMQSLGGSEFGSSFFTVEPVDETAKHHVQVRRNNLNWSPSHLIQRLNLIAMSLTNIISSLQCDLGVDPTSVQFHRPTEHEAFDAVWDDPIGIRRSNLAQTVRLDPRQLPGRDELLQTLNRVEPDA